MRMSIIRRWSVSILCLTAVLTSAIAGSGDSPESVIKAFYSHINKGEYTQAKELYTADTKKTMDGPAMDAGGFGRWAEMETRRGTVTSVTVLSSQAQGDGASITYAVQYKDGDKSQNVVFCTKEKGVWRIGLIVRRPS